MAALTEAMKSLVLRQRLGYVASVTPEGIPRVSPKGSLTVWDDDHLVFADIESPNTVKNLSANPRTEVNVVDPFTRKGFRFQGTATVLHGGPKYFEVLERYKAEGSDIRRVRAVVIVKVENVSPLLSPTYAAGFSEDEVRRLWEEYYAPLNRRTVVDLVPPVDF
jgi:uncharacterized protein